MGPQRYNFASIIEVLRHKKRFARVIIDNNSIGADFAFIIGCNTIHTGKGMRMAPLARLNDGLIDLIIVRKVSRFKLLKLFPSFLESMIVTAELAKFNVNGLKGSIRLKGLFFVYFATFYSWIDDKTLSLEKTMTALDKNLDQAEKFSKYIK